MCTDWSPMMNFNWEKLGPAERERRLKAARRHLRFCVRIYKIQAENYRYFVHEQPAQAKSWKEPEMQKMIRKEKNILTQLDQCRYGLWIKDKHGKVLAKKPTKFLTNSPCIAEQLARRCTGVERHPGGRHASLFDGVAKQAPVYP